jgi:hypothetical protein
MSRNPCTRARPELLVRSCASAEVRTDRPVKSVVLPRDRTSARAVPVEDRSIGSSVLLTKRHSRQIFLDSLLLGGIAGGDQAVGEGKEALSFLIHGLQTRLDQTSDDPACRRALALRQGSDSARHARRKCHALSHGPFRGCHSFSIHQAAPGCTTNLSPCTLCESFATSRDGG